MHVASRHACVCLSRAAAVSASLLLIAPPAQAGLVEGLQKVVAGVFAVPVSTLAGTFIGPPILGTVFGAVSGAVNGVGLVVSGVFDVAMSAVPIAKTVAPILLPIFL